ncbi:integrator complex subunit 2 [Dictyostelium discoideum AX4]|uniref:Integrator complex subunit 2 homolog n=1 Tax=Dictyostelium discoideum TaxID=44689 RepID=INT2_DICDI|nr:integrator complex subunit 2 [Dictyostelium discoideum AX4]Q55CB6.1 RecName: Full=Integrator complex subunit 2 homolog [Dictyostelium discoideum]EAL72870.1 integrator complex subunit 2 [Dictyostelium discoideum AX4]|eukprot:XP_646565.1 integrator complex subunit 2 [Dictyostelium discoideum AX4]
MITSNNNNKNNNKKDVEMKSNEEEGDEIFFSILSGDTNNLFKFLNNNNSNNNNNNNNNNINNSIDIYLPYIIVGILEKNKDLLDEDENLKKLFYSPIYSKSIHNINQYQSLNFDHINEFIKDQVRIRKKLNHVNQDKKDTYLDNIDNPKYQFENGDKEVKMKLVLSDIIALLEFSEMQQSLTISKETKYDAPFIDTPIYNNELNLIFPIICYKCLKHIDFNKLTLSILFLNQANYLIKLLLSNNPNEFNEIIEIVISSIGLIGVEKVKRVLLEICKLSKYCSRFIRTELINRQMLPDLVLLITSQFVKDEIDLLSNIISNRIENQWLKEYISQKDQFSTFNEIRDSLFSTLELISKEISSNSNNNSNNLEHSFIVKSIIRLYCGFSGLLGIKMNQQEISISLSFIEKSIFKNYSKIFLCFLLVCEGLVKTIHPKKELVGYLNHLCKVGNCDELLLLISIYFHTHQLQNIALLVKNILGFRPSIHTESLNQIGEILTKEIYTESLVAKRAQQLPIIEKLNTNHQNISIVCVYHLLSERIFEKYETDVGNWCWSQLTKSSTPIHYLLPSLLDQLCKNIIEPSINNNNTSSTTSIINTSTTAAAASTTASNANTTAATTTTTTAATITTATTTGTTTGISPSSSTTTTSSTGGATSTSISSPNSTSLGNSYLFSTFSSTSSSSSSGLPFYMKRISESIIMNSIQQSQSNLSVQILIIYFVLRYNDSVIKFKSEQKGKPIQFLIETTQLREYNIEFLSKLPIQNCINVILSNQSDYFYIIPPFLYLILSQFPQFFNINLLLLEEERLLNPIEKFIYLPNFYSINGGANNNSGGITNEFLKDTLKRTLSQPTSVQLILRYLNTLSVKELLPFTTTLLDNLLPIIIKNRSLPSVSALISPFVEIWERVFPISQSSIALKTINILTCINDDKSTNNNKDLEDYNNNNNNNNDDVKMKDKEKEDKEEEEEEEILLPISNYTYTDIISDPLVIFRSHPTVFTCPPLFKILLQILFFYMVSSKKNLQNQLHTSSGSGSGTTSNVTLNKQQQEDVSTLILTQESTIIQILLEICLIDGIDTKGLNKILRNKNKKFKESYDPVDIEEIRCQICSFIHQMFIDKPLIIKLVHFQGYLSQLLPITVTLIPSMHICFEFIPELLAQPSLEKQIFAIQLLSYLSEKFPIPKSLKICRQSQTRISFNLNSNTLSYDDRIKFLHSILPSITRITKTFPLLAEDFVSILMEQLPNKHNYQQNLKSFISSIDFNLNSNLNNYTNSIYLQNNKNNNNSSNNNNSNNQNDLLNIDIDNNINSNNNNNLRNINFKKVSNDDKSFFSKVSKNESWLSIKENNDPFNIPIEQEIHQAIQIIIKNLSK